MEEVTVFAPEEVDGFKRWVDHHPSGYVFTLKGADYGVLHDAACSHIEVLPGDKGKGSAKVCARRIPDLRRWANTSGYRVRWCDTCQS
jgi:hypothetical protein